MGKKKKYPTLKEKEKKKQKPSKFVKSLRKQYKQTKEESDEIKEMLGGTSVIKAYGLGLEAYVERMQRSFIIEDITPEEYCESCQQLKEIIEDMKKGETYMFDYDGVSAYADRQEKSNR